MGLKEPGAITGIGETAVAAVPGPAGVRVWEVMSLGRRPRGRCPPPEGVDVAYPHPPVHNRSLLSTDSSLAGPLK